MSIIAYNYFYNQPARQERPEWYRLERCDYCDHIGEDSSSAKRGIFRRRNDKKHSR